MPPVRRAAAAPVTKSGGSVNFGEDSFYLGGLGLPEGMYATFYHTQMFQPTKMDGTPSKTPPFLAVILTAVPIDAQGNPTPGVEPSEHPLGCGQKTHESFVPSADGKGFETVAGGSGIGMNENCNWSLYRKSLVDSGLPPGTLTNDLSVIDGTWVRTRNIPEPEERKNFRGKTATGEAALRAAMGGEAANADAQRNKVCITVFEILEGGKPWEGTGGLLEASAAPAKPAVTARVAPKAAAPVARGRVVAPAPPAQEAEMSEEDLKSAALNGIGEVLATQPNGCFKVKLSTGTFAAVAAAQGDDVAGAVIEMFFQDNEVLNTLLGELGYVVNGAKVEVLK